MAYTEEASSQDETSAEDQEGTAEGESAPEMTRLFGRLHYGVRQAVPQRSWKAPSGQALGF